MAELADAGGNVLNRNTTWTGPSVFRGAMETEAAYDGFAGSSPAAVTNLISIYMLISDWLIFVACIVFSAIGSIMYATALVYGKTNDAEKHECRCDKCHPYECGTGMNNSSSGKKIRKKCREEYSE